MMTERRNTLIMVNERDEWLGTIDKLEAHREGVLHRAVSVFILNDRDELLLQKRAAGKYHSPGLWTNACCSHPMPGESTKTAAQRRLREEMDIEVPLEPCFELRYRADVGNGLVENEYDHIFWGRCNGTGRPDPQEASESRFFSLDAIGDWMRREPDAFTVWFRLAFPGFLSRMPRS